MEVRHLRDLPNPQYPPLRPLPYPVVEMDPLDVQEIAEDESVEDAALLKIANEKVVDLTRALQLEADKMSLCQRACRAALETPLSAETRRLLRAALA